MRAKRKGPPVIAVTMGDPAGIGPEVILKTAAALRARRSAPSMLVIGDLAVMRETARRVHGAPEIREYRASDASMGLPERLSVLPASMLSATARRPGRATVEGAHAAFGYIERGAKMALRGEVDALVTAPISKEWLNRAGHRFPGHTELLAAIAKVKTFRMMFSGDVLKLALVTVHMPLREVPAALNVRSVLDTIRLLARHLSECHGVARARIGVLGLNPHAGEHGLFGDEEQRTITPAVRRAQREGIDAFGPLAPDTAFVRTRRAFQFDAVVAMYHDQGLIALKALEFERAVNVTLGLPFIRTSPDHGTAFDIAGKGAASASSMLAALEYAGRAAAVRAATHRRAA
ncbi:MAG: 4-hydroxythreonine-4-phosphate dehydrogenase PdxA [Candidatus Binataceae bacterium]